MTIGDDNKGSAEQTINTGGDVIGGDKIAGDKIGGDKVLGDKIDYHIYYQSTTAPANPQQQRNRRTMLAKVKTIWINGLLEDSLAEVVKLDLGLVDTPEAVDLPLTLQYQELSRQPRPIPSGTAIIDVFTHMSGALLILGAPGAGKTTLLLELARDLIARAEQDENHPIPMVFNLSSWAAKRLPLKKWLVQELNTKYTAPHKIAQKWVDDNAILPLLDGLDEVAAEHRAECVEAINAFRQAYGFVPLVVCCRVADYDRLQTRLTLSGAILVQPLEPQQIDAYLVEAGTKLTALRIALEEDLGLQELARSPLMLSLMVVVYEHTRPIVTADRRTFDEQRRHLFVAYIERLFQRRGDTTHYARQQTIQWLRWLARTLVQHA